jgi:hypothetical protein
VESLVHKTSFFIPSLPLHQQPTYNLKPFQTEHSQISNETIMSIGIDVFVAVWRPYGNPQLVIDLRDNVTRDPSYKMFSILGENGEYFTDAPYFPDFKGQKQREINLTQSNAVLDGIERGTIKELWAKVD